VITIPNIYRNALDIQSDKPPIEQILAAIADTEAGIGSIDFDKISPTPPWAKADAETLKRWRKDNWNVAENALNITKFDDDDTGVLIEFDTAGSDVRDLMCKLSVMFPLALFGYAWASADVGADTGAVQYQDGELIYNYPTIPKSCESFELSFDLFGSYPEDHGLILDEETGNYKYNTEGENE
jgi:hypothetical protein